MFDILTGKLTAVLNKLGNKGRLSEKDVDEALREVRLALLEADVNFKVVRSFISTVREQVVGNEILATITGGQYVVKTTHDELVKILGGSSQRLNPSPSAPSVIMMVGLNGSGKTTSAAKLAQFLKKSGHLTTLIAADVHRPAAIDQLQSLAKQLDIRVFDQGTDKPADKVATHGLNESKRIGATWAIVDTAGRFQIDDELMLELVKIRDSVNPDEVLLVVDAMTGQEAVNVAEEFHKQIGLTGLVLTKMDGDARGGAALSITSVTGLPVKFMGVGEAVNALEEFHPDRLADRILGMGDIVTLVEKARANFNDEEAAILEKKIKQASFDLEDFLAQMQTVQKMGPINQIMDMIPGFSQVKDKLDTNQLNGSQLKKSESIILSMTSLERQKPELIGGSRRKRIAMGSGTSPQDVNQLLNQFKQVRKMMKEMSSPGGQKKMMRMMSQKGNPFGF